MKSITFWIYKKTIEFSSSPPDLTLPYLKINIQLLEHHTFLINRMDASYHFNEETTNTTDMKETTKETKTQKTEKTEENARSERIVETSLDFTQEPLLLESLLTEPFSSIREKMNEEDLAYILQKSPNGFEYLFLFHCSVYLALLSFLSSTSGTFISSFFPFYFEFPYEYQLFSGKPNSHSFIEVFRYLEPILRSIQLQVWDIDRFRPCIICTIVLLEMGELWKPFFPIASIATKRDYSSVSVYYGFLSFLEQWRVMSQKMKENSDSYNGHLEHLKIDYQKLEDRLTQVESQLERKKMKKQKK